MPATCVPASYTYLGELLSHPRYAVKVWTNGLAYLAQFGQWTIVADSYADLGRELAQW